MANKIIGINFLEQHKKKQDELGLDDAHVIVDKEDWQAMIEILRDKPFILSEYFEIKNKRDADKQRVQAQKNKTRRI